MAKKSAASAKPAKAAASSSNKDSKTNKKQPASSHVTNKKPEECDKPLSKAEKEKAKKMRVKRILVAVVCALLVVAFCLPSAIYLISGAKSDTTSDSTEESQNQEAQYEELVAGYLEDLAADPTAAKNYKRLGATYYDWAGDIVSGEITTSTHTAGELYGLSVAAYQNYLANDSEASASTYKSIASVYSDWASAVANGSAESDSSVDQLFQAAIDSLNTYISVSGKTSGYSSIADTYLDWASVVTSNAGVSSYDAATLYEKAVEANLTLAQTDSSGYIAAAEVYSTWAGNISSGTIENSAVTAEETWNKCVQCYDQWLANSGVSSDSTEYSEVLVSKANALNEAGNSDAAAAILIDLTNSQPTYMSAWLQLANIYEDKGEIETAESYYKKMIEANPDSPYGYYYYAYFLQNQDDTEGALEQYQKALDADPDDTYGLKSMIELMMGSLESSDDEASDGDSEEGFFKRLFSKKSE